MVKAPACRADDPGSIPDESELAEWLRRLLVTLMIRVRIPMKATYTCQVAMAQSCDRCIGPSMMRSKNDKGAPILCAQRTLMSPVGNA